MNVADPADIPKRNSSDADWKAWYDILPFSQADNNRLFTKAWKVRGSVQANTSDLRTYLGGKGIHLEAGTLNILGSIKDEATGVLNAVGSFIKTGETVVLGGMIVGGIFTAALLWRILTPDNVGKGLDIAGKAALMA